MWLPFCIEVVGIGGWRVGAEVWRLIVCLKSHFFATFLLREGAEDSFAHRQALTVVLITVKNND